jgi:hypothetical protein
VGVTYVVVRHLKFPPRFTIMKPPSVDRMVIFFIALLLFCFEISNLATRISVSIMSALVTALVIWCIWTAWESNDDESVWQESLIVFQRARSNLFKRVKGLNPFRTRRVPRHVPHDDHITLTRTDRLGRV